MRFDLKERLRDLGLFLMGVLWGVIVCLAGG